MQIVAYLQTVDALSGAHGGLDIETLDLLPVLGEEGDEEVNGGVNVGLDLLLGHGDVGNGNTHAEGLLGLELELDSAADLIDLGLDSVTGVDTGGELAGLVETRSENTGNETDDGGGSKEGIVAVSEILDLLLVLVEELELILGHGVKTASLGLGVVDIVTEDADAELGAGDVGEDDRAGEALVLGGVVGLERDLELNGLHELALVLLGIVEDGLDAVLDVLAGKLAVLE